MNATKRYDKEFKERIVKLSYERGNVLSVSREFGVSYNTVFRWRKCAAIRERKEKVENNPSECEAFAFWWLFHWWIF
jgi:transposase-like protein